MDAQQAGTFALDWLQGWNQRDVEAILSHYAEDVEFKSLIAVNLLGETSSTIRGKANLREFLEKVLTAFPGSPEIELLGVFRGVDSLVVHFQSRGRKAAEVMELNESGQICRALAHGQI